MARRIISLVLCIVMVTSICTTMNVCTVTSVAAAKTKKIGLNRKSAILYSGKTLKLKLKSAKASKVKWKVKNKKIASVSKKGVVKAKKAGTTVVTAKYKKKTYKCNVRVCSVKKLGTANVTESKNSAKIKGVEVTLSPMMFTKTAKFTLKKVSGLPKMGGAKMKVYDFSLSNAKVTSSNVALIQIPYKAKAGKIPVAGYFNAKTNKWESVMCDYDGKNISIVASHFSPYGVGEISSAYKDFVIGKNETTAFVLNCWVPKTPSITGERAVEIMTEAMKATAPTTSCSELGLDAVNELFDKTINWGANFTSAFGFKDKFTIATGNLSNELGAIGFVLSYVSAVRYALKGEHIQATSTALQGALGFATGVGFSWIGTVAASAGAFATTVVSYALTKGYSDTLSANEQKWFDVFNAYYRRGGSGYRSPAQWRDVLLPIIEDKTLPLNERDDKINQEISAYAWKLWNNEAEIAYVFNDTQTKALKGGLNDELKLKLSRHLIAELYEGNLKIVFEWLQKKSMRDAEAASEKAFARIAETLSETTHITFKDNSYRYDEDYSLEGWTVRWKDIPKNIKDKDRLILKVKKKGGEVSTYYSVYAAVAYGIKPVVEICAPNGKVVDTQTMVYKDKFSTYYLATKKVREYLANQVPTLNKSKLTLQKGKKYTLKLKNANASNVKWKSSKKSVATVSDKGVVKAKKNGKTTITATYKGKTYKCTVKVAKGHKHCWKLVSVKDYKVGMDNVTIHSDLSGHTRIISGTVNKGTFWVKNVYTSSWQSDQHSGKCENEFNECKGTVTGFKKYYEVGDKAKLKLTLTINHSQYYCNGNTDYYTLSAPYGNVYLNVRSASGTTKTNTSVYDYFPEGDYYKKSHNGSDLMDLVCKIECLKDWMTGEHYVKTVYTYKWID